VGYHDRDGHLYPRHIGKAVVNPLILIERKLDKIKKTLAEDFIEESSAAELRDKIQSILDE
jgi:protein-arginine kinase activator protein McsA